MLSSRETHFALTVPLSTLVYDGVLALSIASVILWVILNDKHSPRRSKNTTIDYCYMNLDECGQYGTLRLMETF